MTTSQDYPISTPTWTLQERYLSPAILHFDQDDACWECRNGMDDGREIDNAWGILKAGRIARRVLALLKDATRVQFTLI